MSAEVDIWIAKQACAELIYRFARGLDRCDADIITGVFHEDATDDHGIFVGTAKDFVAWVIPQLSTMERTQHCVTNVIVDVVGDQAWSESQYVAYHDLADAEGRPLRYIAAGRYLDRFEKRDGTWRIAHRTSISDWSETGPRNDTWDRENGPRRYGMRGRQDPVYSEGMAPAATEAPERIEA